MSEALERSQKQEYTAYVERLTTQVIAALPISVPDEALKRSRARFRVAFSADAQGALLECSADSIARAIVLSAMSGLFPGGPKPDVWLIPRRNKHKGNALEVNWQLSFRGFIRLARRAGWDLEPVLVFEGEEFRVEEGMEPKVQHVRNLNVEQSWTTLRYAYVRILPPAGGRAKLAYLNKAQIAQRRAKAQDDGIWREWPLEMAMKSICNYAGNREAFPLDDPARYAMEASEQAELGSGSASSIGIAGQALPIGSRSELLLDRLKDEGATIDLSGRQEPDLAEPLPAGPVQVADDLQQPVGGRSQEVVIEELRALLKAHGKTGPARDEALQHAYGDPSWLRVIKLPAPDLEAGLQALRRQLDGLADMAAEREPGSDDE